MYSVCKNSVGAISFALPDRKEDAVVEAFERAEFEECARRRFSGVGFGELYERMSFSAYETGTKEQEACKDAGIRFAQRVSEGHLCNVVLEGPCGTGKTSLMACIAREVVKHPNNKCGDWDRFGIGNYLSASYHKSASITEAFVKSQSFNARQGFTQTLGYEFSSDLVIVDEVGTGGAREQDALYELIDWCSRKRICMAFGTNLDNNAFSEILGARSCSRLRGITTIIDFGKISDQRAKYNRLRCGMNGD